MENAEHESKAARHVSAKTRAAMVRAFELWNQGNDHASIAAELGVSRRTACRYVHEERSNQPHFERAERRQERKVLNQFFREPDDLQQTIERIQHFSPNGYRAVVESLTATQLRTFYLYFRDKLTLDEVAYVESVEAPAISRRVERIQQKFIDAGLHCPMRQEPYQRVREITSSWHVNYRLGESVCDCD